MDEEAINTNKNRSAQQLSKKSHKGLVEREPEREPEYNCMEGNVTLSVLDNEKTMMGRFGG